MSPHAPQQQVIYTLRGIDNSKLASAILLDCAVYLLVTQALIVCSRMPKYAILASMLAVVLFCVFNRLLLPNNPQCVLTICACLVYANHCVAIFLL
jgi:hypothetical protein